MSTTPRDWSPCRVDLEADVLLGFTEFSMHVVAPPAVRFRPDEPDSQRVGWRHVVWFLHGQDDEPTVTADLPDEVLTMRTVEVVEMLSEKHHSFVRSAMARQLRRAALMERVEEGVCPADRYAQMANRCRGWVDGELAEAFPEESWFKRPAHFVEIPWTAEELLVQIPVAEETTLPSRMLRHGCKRRLMVAYWVASAVGWLPWADRASNRLIAKVVRWSERSDALSGPLRTR